MPRLFHVALFIGLLGCLGLPAPAQAVTYFVATNGNDSYTAEQAQNITTPWKTIQKAASNMVAGDHCRIRSGTYREPTITVANSGTASAPITFQAHDRESDPVTIDGTDIITNWKKDIGNIWKAPMTGSLGDGNQVFVYKVMKPEARWPNAGASFPWQDSTLAHPSPYNALGNWSYVDTAGYANNANGWFTDAQLPTRDDGYWYGATVHIMSGYGWIFQTPTVMTYSDSEKKITTNDAYGANGAYAITAGNEFYLTGIKGEMDSAGEWFYNTSDSTLSIYSINVPANVTAKKRNYCFNLSGRSYINLVKLKFFACTVQTDSYTSNTTYDGLEMKYLGHNRKNSSIFGLTLRNGDVLRNSELGWDSQGLVKLAGSDIRVINNYFHDSGYVSTWTAMVDAGINNPPSLAYQRNLISHNTLHDSGRSAMGFPGRASIVEFNNLYNAMKMTTDGGIFYSNLDAGNSIIRYNLLHDSIGPAGHSGSPVMGFYLDAQNSNWIVHHNIIWNLPGYAIQINQRHNFNKIFNNTTWNTASGSLLASFPMNQETGTHVFNNLFNGPPVGSTWGLSDVRFNLYTDPLFFAPASGDFRLQSNSLGINTGTPIPGVTDIYPNSVVDGTPDRGALESGGTDWTTFVGYKTTPPSPDPTYSNSTMIFANQVKEGSFESATTSPMTIPNWTIGTNSNVTVFSSHSWNDSLIRTGGRSLKFGAGTSEVRQKITGLLPNRRYKVYGGVQTTDASSVVKLGVRNFGFSPLEVTASPVTLPPPGTSTNADVRWWTVYNQSFVTGPNSTSAEIYLSVAIPSGTSALVYADDFGLELVQSFSVDPVFPMPAFHLPFNETGGGFTAYDATTNGRSGIIDGATWGSGVFGNALYFDGANDYVSVPGPVPATSLGSFTVATWVKFNDMGTATVYPTLVSNNNDSWVQKGWQIKVAKVSSATNFKIGFYMWQDNLTGPATWLTQTVPPGQWAHVAFVVDRGNRTITGYLNGVASSNTTIPPEFTNVDTTLGTRVGSATLTGQLDDVRIYSRALSGNDVLDISMRNSNNLLGPPYP